MADIEVAGLVTKISIDDTQLNKSMAELDRKMKLVKSEFDKASSGVKDFGKSSDDLRNKADALNKQLELQGVNVAKLNAAHQKSVAEKGADAAETQKLETQLNKAAAQYNRLHGEIQANNEQLAAQQKAAAIAASSWTQLGDSLNTAGNKIKSAGDAMTNAGQQLSLKVTAPLVALGGLSTKAAIDFESAFAGVRKTVSTSEEKFAELETGIRKMSTEIPVAATEIAKVGEAAGQLGIKTEAIMGFTRTMVDLGVATNMSSDEAATALARLANITQMPQESFDRLGATIVELGNNLATTESEIVEMGLRIAGAGAQIGLTEAQILAFAGSLSSVGIEAEAGGSAVSRVMVDIANAVAVGGDSVKGFADVAGMSIEDFRKAFQEDAAGAIVSFVEGLGRISDSGGNVFAVLEDLQLSEIRVRDSLLRMSGAGDVLRGSLDLASEAWEENTALTDEASERYKTTASQLQIFKNRITDVGITLGNALIPALIKALEALQPLLDLLAKGAQWFAGLNDSTRAVIISVAAFAAALGPVLIVTGALLSSIGSITIAVGNMSKRIGEAVVVKRLATTATLQLAGASATTAAATTAAATGMGVASRAAGILSVAVRTLLGPIGLAITAITLLVSAFGAVSRHLGKDAIPAVKTFGDESGKAMDKASGSFKKFRNDAETTLQDTAKVAGKQGAAIGDNINKGAGGGAKKAKDAVKDAMKEMTDELKKQVDAQKKIVDDSTESINKLGDAIVTALKKQYGEQEKAQTDTIDLRLEGEKKASDGVIKNIEREGEQRTKAIDQQLKDEKRASDERLKIYDKEYAEKLKLVDAEAYEQIKALQDQIDAIDGQTEAEDKATKEQEHINRLAELNKQMAAAETAEEREKIQRDLNKTILDYERRQLLDQRRIQKDVLKGQIDVVKETANAKKDEIRQELTDLKDLEKEKLSALQDSLADQKTEVKNHYDKLKEDEKGRLKEFQDGLEAEKEAVKEYFAERTESENLQAEARKMIVEESNEEIISLLKTYNPKWQDAGQSFADSFANGLNSEKQTIEDAVKGIVEIAPAIDAQIQELDRLQEKLKEIEEITSKASADGSGGGGGGGGGLSGLTVQADDLTESLYDLVPALEDMGAAVENETGRSIDAFTQLNNQAQIALNQLYWSGAQITEDTASTIADTFYAMGTEVKANMEDAHGEQLQALQTFFDNNKTLTDAEKAKMLEDLKTAQETEKTEIGDNQNRIFEILSLALDEQRGLTKSEYEEMNNIRNNLLDVAERNLTDAQVEQKRIFEQMKKDGSTESAALSAEVVKNSLDMKEKSIQAAEDQYDEVVKAAIRLRDDTGTISKEAADKMIDEAQRQRDESIRLAEEMHKKVVQEAKDQARDHINEVDWETGEILSKWETFKLNFMTKWGEIYQGIMGWIDKLKEINLVEVGGNIMQGFIDGITGKKGKVQQVVTELGGSVEEAMKKKLDVRSPSRVMMRIGEFTGEGMAVGLANSLDDIRKQSQAMAAAALPLMEGVSLPGTNIGSRGLSGSSTDQSTTHNYAGMFDGATFAVRDDRDIEAIAAAVSQVISGQSRQAYRGLGGGTI